MHEKSRNTECFANMNTVATHSSITIKKTCETCETRETRETCETREALFGKDISLLILRFLFLFVIVAYFLYMFMALMFTFYICIAL